jgi:hypothetical protein
VNRLNRHVNHACRFSFPPYNYSEQLWAGPLTGGPRGIQVSTPPIFCHVLGFGPRAARLASKAILKDVLSKVLNLVTLPLTVIDYTFHTQVYPHPEKVPAFGKFAGAVAQHFAKRVRAGGPSFIRRI